MGKERGTVGSGRRMTRRHRKSFQCLQIRGIENNEFQGARLEKKGRRDEAIQRMKKDISNNCKCLKKRKQNRTQIYKS